MDGKKIIDKGRRESEGREVESKDFDVENLDGIWG